VVTARGRIHDRTFQGPLARESSAAPLRVQSFLDSAGNSIVIGTSITDLDLASFASILAGTIHGEEINKLRVLIVLPDQVGPECGGEQGVVACYYADDPNRLYSGQIVIPSAHPDLHHAIVHEYGHHMDNQLANFGHLGGCDYGQDGSRRWFFVRDAYDDLTRHSGCTRQVAYGKLLGEVFAEDFVAYNGIDEWFTSDFPPPTARMLDAMDADIKRPFTPRRRHFRGSMLAGYYRGRWLTFDAPVFLTLRLRGPRRADFDLSLMAQGRRRPIARSRRPRSVERITIFLNPGRYRVDVVGYAGRGRYRLVANVQ